MHTFLKSGLYLSTALSVIATASPARAQDAGSGLGDIIVTAQKREQNLQDVPIAVTAIDGNVLAANRVVNVVDLSALAPGVTVRPAPGGLAAPGITVRGAFSTGLTPGMDKQVSMYIDGVYLASPRGSLFDLPNIERIEVLRGPQGTLFGRNATAGAISITTQDPKGEGHMKAGITVGNHDMRRYELSAHTPELGPLSAYFNFVRENYEGHVKNGFIQNFDRSTYAFPGHGRNFRSAERLGGKESDSVFAAVKFESGDFKAVYKYDRNDTDGTPGAIGLVGYQWNMPDRPQFLSDFMQDVYEASGVPVAPNQKRPDEVWNSYSGYQDQKGFGHNLTINYQLNDQIAIKNIAAYRELGVESTTGLFGANALEIGVNIADYLPPMSLWPFLPPEQQAQLAATVAAYPVGATLCTGCAAQQTRNKQWSNELQVNYNSDFLTLTVGGLYFKAKDWTNESGVQSSVVFTSALLEVSDAGDVIPYLPGTYYNEAESLAAYAQGEFHITPQVDLILGGRFTHDNKLAELTSLSSATCTPSATSIQRLACPLNVESDRYKDDNFNYLIGVNYRPTDDILLYAKWSTAFVSGGVTGSIPFDPEKSKSAELGVKADMFDRRLRINLATYWAKYSDYQNSLGVGALPLSEQPRPDDALLNSALANIVVKQGDVDVRGFELEVTAAPVRGVTLGGNLSYSKTKYSNVPDTLFAWQSFPPADGTTDDYSIYSDSDYRPLARPEWTASVFAQYTSEPVWGDARVSARIQANYQSKVYLAAYEDITDTYEHYITDVPGYWLLNGRIALQDVPVGDFKGTLAVWGRNLTDNKSIAFALNQFGTASATYIEPRRYGLDFTVEF